MRFGVDLIIRCTTWPTREKNPTPPVHLGHDFQPTTTVGSSMGHKIWPQKTQSNIEKFDLILMLRECGPKNLPNVRFMLDSASCTNVEFFLACPKPDTWTALYQCEFPDVGSFSISYGTQHCPIHARQRKGWSSEQHGKSLSFFSIISLLYRFIHVINGCTMIHLQYNYLPLKKLI